MEYGVVRRGKEWQKKQFRELMDEHWTDLRESDIAKLAEVMREDRQFGKYVPADRWVPDQDEYIKFVQRDPRSYEQN